VPLDRLLAPAARDGSRALPELGHERGHALVAARKRVGAALDLRRQDGHLGSLAASSAYS
jgi:hypothetical protein